MSTYTQTDGTEDATYFQDVQISPATLKDGSLLARMDTKRFPKVGVKVAVNPTITSVSPATLEHGKSGTLTIKGTNFGASASVVTVSGANVTVASVDTTHAGTVLVVKVTAAGGAALTARNVTVTNPDGGTATATNALTVVPVAVAITNVAPATAAQGATLDVVITGSGFAAGAVTTFSGTGVTVNSTTVNSATQLTVNITVGGSAALTARNVTVTNTDTGTATANGALTVTV